MTLPSNLDRAALYQFANQGIAAFHVARLARLQSISLTKILKSKNPYLFRAKNILTASELVEALLSAFLSSSEEEMFGRFLEQLAIFISEQAVGGRKSSTEGIDLEFDRDNVRYLVAIKSGPNWGNSSQSKRLEENFKQALRVLKQNKSRIQIQPVLGICYGNKTFAEKGWYDIVLGQRFWHFLSDDADLYLDIIEPIGFQAQQHNDDFLAARAAIINRFTAEFIESFARPDYSIDWDKLVAFNSGNM